MRKFTLAFSRNGSIIVPPDEPIISDVPELSDLVTLGILPKQLSEYTDADIGSIILIPYNDESGKFLLINGCIEFEVVGVNHHKDINDELKPTITLMTRNIIRYAAFDAKESNNPNSERANYGNNRWSVSNIRQWLNSEVVDNSWYRAKHDYDAEPNTTNVGHNASSAYSDYPGFLAGFNNEIKQHLATVKNKTILCNADMNTLSKDFEETEDKVFLPSYTEMGFGNLVSNNPEGNHLAQKFIDNKSRVKFDGDNIYWMRSPDLDSTAGVCLILENGHYETWCYAYDGYTGIAPLLVLC